MTKGKPVKAKSKEKKHPLMYDADLVTKYNAVFKTVEGREVLYDLLQFGFFMQGTGNGENSRLNEGRREVCLHIMEVMNTDPNDILRLIEEEAIKKQDTYGGFDHVNMQS